MDLNQAYEILEVTEKEDFEQIKLKYKKLCEKYNPNLYQEATVKELIEEKLKEINEAYKVIENEKTSQEKEIILKNDFIKDECERIKWRILEFALSVIILAGIFCWNYRYVIGFDFLLDHWAIGVSGVLLYSKYVDYKTKKMREILNSTEATTSLTEDELKNMQKVYLDILDDEKVLIFMGVSLIGAYISSIGLYLEVLEYL